MLFYSHQRSLSVVRLHIFIYLFFFLADPHKKGVTLLFQLLIEWHSDYFSQGQKFAWGVIVKGLLKMPLVDQTISDAKHLKTGSLWL